MCVEWTDDAWHPASRSQVAYKVVTERLYSLVRYRSPQDGGIGRGSKIKYSVGLRVRRPHPGIYLYPTLRAAQRACPRRGAVIIRLRVPNKALIRRGRQMWSPRINAQEVVVLGVVPPREEKR